MMGESTQVVSAKVVRWEWDIWGVVVDYADGKRVAFHAKSRQDAKSQLDKIMADPEFATRLHGWRPLQ
jgi:hypothetical protein